MSPSDDTLHLIVNPVARNGGALRIAKDILALLRAKEIPYIVRETTCRGDASVIADQWVREGVRSVWCLGGDGTVQETAQGLVGTPCALGIIPGGTGNDFAAMVGLASDPIAALTAQLGSSPRKVDAARFNDQWFLNVCGTGFDVDTLIHTEKAKRYVKGLLAYTVGVLRAIFTHRDVTLEIAVDGEPMRRKLLMISVCNGKRFGGGMRVAPDASITDGLFDLVLIHPVSKMQIIGLLPLFIQGRHTRLPFVEIIRCRDVEILSSEMVMNVDGDLVPCHGAHLSIRPQALNILAPA